MNTTIFMAFPCMFTHICLDMGVAEVPGIDMLLRLKTKTNLGLIRDVSNPISKEDKLGATIIQGAFEDGGHRDDTAGFTDMGDSPTKTGHSKNQTSNVEDT
ncbi:hypothetical protein FXO38_35844 [Capsicum annuum]|nr:hypothetical protein FXO38_35844 [Capsicum annuum]KAF3644439.1 hypothetical protein FXO37_21444 [Capsicum annuum]